MPNLEKFPTSASLAIRTSTPNQHAQRENRRRTVVERCYVEENRRRAVSYVSTGLARLPRDTVAHATTAEVRLYKKKEMEHAQAVINEIYRNGL